MTIAASDHQSARKDEQPDRHVDVEIDDREDGHQRRWSRLPWCFRDRAGEPQGWCDEDHHDRKPGGRSLPRLAGVCCWLTVTRRRTCQRRSAGARNRPRRAA